MTKEEFEKETAAFYMEIERERARILRNLLRYFGGKKWNSEQEM